MLKYIPGMIVRQKAINVWPYIGTMIERINKAADADSDKCLEAIDEVILDAAKLVTDHMKLVTLDEIPLCQDRCRLN